MSGREAMVAANRAHSERRARRQKNLNAAANKAAAARWVGGETGSQLTAEELAERFESMRVQFYSRHPECA